MTTRKLLFEIICILLTISTIIILSHIAFEGHLITNNFRTSLHYGVTIFFTIIVYAMMRCIFPALSASLITISLCVFLHSANYYKAKLTNQPLYFNDISSFYNISISFQFLSWIEITIIGILTLLLLLYTVHIIIKKGRNLFFSLAILTTLILSVLYVHTNYKQKAVRYLDSKGLLYQNWNPTSNFNDNGLIIHLFQTSARSIPTKPTDNQLSIYNSLKNNINHVETLPKNVILVLCESCWFDENNYHQNFAPLFSLKPTQLRALSPIMGGGTPNATFEMISGLPVINPAIYGVFYQEYGDLISREPDTTPKILNNLGIPSYSLHNFHGGMYRRSEVEPKLGFDQFIGLEKMNKTDEVNYFPRDYILYDEAKNILEKGHEKGAFMHLATVYLHGPYRNKSGDSAEIIYGEKLTTTVADAADFVQFAMNLPDDTVVLLYGDHKPPLWSFFKDKTAAEIADVPMLLFDRDASRRELFFKAANTKPFYCIGGYISQIYYGFSLPSSHFTEDACKEEDIEARKTMQNLVPKWVYHQALFAN